MSGDTEKRAGFDKWLKRLANDLRVTVEYGRSPLPILRRKLVPLLKTTSDLLDARERLRKGSGSVAEWVAADVAAERLRADLDKLKGKS